MHLSVREIQENELHAIPAYFLNASEDFLHAMGADKAKLPGKEEWLQLLIDDYRQPNEQKKFFYVLWLADEAPVGHSNINKIIFGEEAFMHLHLWGQGQRQKGMGVEFIKMSIPFYFEQFKLKNLYCEPYTLNPAPNKVLEKIGFDFIQQYETTPGWINFHQPVNRWCMSFEKYKTLYK